MLSVDKDARTLVVRDEYGNTAGLSWDDIERNVPFEADPVEEDTSGRHRPEAFQACKQDPEQRARARAALTDGADKLLECPDCGELVERRSMFDHPCDPAPEHSTRVAAGGSCSFAEARAQLWGLRVERLWGPE